MNPPASNPAGFVPGFFQPSFSCKWPVLALYDAGSLLCRLEAELAKAGVNARQADEVRREVRFTRRNSGALQVRSRLLERKLAARESCVLPA